MASAATPTPSVVRSTPKDIRTTLDPDHPTYHQTPNEDSHYATAIPNLTLDADREGDLVAIEKIIRDSILAFDLSLWPHWLQDKSLEGGATLSGILALPKAGSTEVDLIHFHVGDSPTYVLSPQGDGSLQCHFLNDTTRHVLPTQYQTSPVEIIDGIPSQFILWDDNGEVYRLNDSLMMYRSVGDFYLRHIGHSAQATIAHITTPRRSLALVASDAISDELTPEEIASHCQGKILTAIPETLEAGLRATLGGLMDDTTSIILNLQDLGQPYLIGVTDGHSIDAITGALYAQILAIFMQIVMPHMLAARNKTPAEQAIAINDAWSNFHATVIEKIFTHPAARVNPPHKLKEWFNHPETETTFKKNLSTIFSNDLEIAVLKERLKTFMVKSNIDNNLREQLIADINNVNKDNIAEGLNQILQKLPTDDIFPIDFKIIFAAFLPPNNLVRHQSAMANFILEREDIPKDTQYEIMKTINAAKDLHRLHSSVHDALYDFSQSNKNCCMPLWECFSGQQYQHEVLFEFNERFPTSRLASSHSAETAPLLA